MTGVVIGAGRDAIHTIEKAKEQGIYVVALDGNPEAAGMAHADRAVTVDISKQEKVDEVIEQVRPDFVIPVPIGRYLLTTGYVNERYRLKGAGYQATELSVDKYLFHKRLQEKKLRPIEFFLINQDTDKQQVSISYPAILKPRFGSGSRDVFCITCEQELQEACEFAINSGEDFVLEQMVQGTEYGLDGAVMNGKLQITLLRQKVITPLPARQAVASISMADTAEHEELYQRVYRHMQEVIEVLGYNDCLVNADIILSGEQVFVIEIAPRPSGHYLHDVFVPQTTGVDLAEEYIRFLSGKEYGFVPKEIKCMRIQFFKFENVSITKVPQEAALRASEDCRLVRWECNIKEGDCMEPVVNGPSIMGRGFFIVQGENEQDLEAQCDWVLRQFGVEAL